MAARSVFIAAAERVAASRIVRARFDQHFVQLQQTLLVRSIAQSRIEFRKIEPIFSGADFVEHFAEAENVGLRRARAFRRNVTFGADERTLAADRHETDIGKLGCAIDENNVGRLDVAMREAAGVQRFERFG